MDRKHHRPEACAERRAALVAKLQGAPCLIAAGQAVSRNYPAATYPYRASSHFLFFVGLPLEGAVAAIDATGCTLFVPTPHPDDALWHGACPSAAEIGEWTGCDVRPLEELTPRGIGRDTATLPAPDALTRRRQSAWLGRPIEPEELAPMDEALAQAVVELRLTKDTAALEGIRHAVRTTLAAHQAGMHRTALAPNEAVIVAAMEEVIRSRGMVHAYAPIVTVEGEVLHHAQYGNALQDGDLLLADVGAESAGGWASDVTRTWPVNGRFSSSQRDIYDVVLAAQLAAIAAIRPGVRFRQVHEAACRALTSGLIDLGILRGDVDELVADGVHALVFPHGVGHAMGLDVHDMEDLGDRVGYPPGRKRSSAFGLGALRFDRDLQTGMVVTVEPGFYRVPAILERPELRRRAGERVIWSALAQYEDVRGIRIEDDVLVTDDGCEVLTAGLVKDADSVQQQVAP